jgi:hypothetical protein
VRVTFVKLPARQHEMLVTERRQGPDVRAPAHDDGPRLPHDLVHAIVESELDLERGFWDAVDHGADFGTFRPVGPRRHRGGGHRHLRRFGDDVMAAELVVTWVHRRWIGLPTEGRGLGPPRVGEADAARCVPLLDEAHRIWDGLVPGQALAIAWPLDPGAPFSASGPRCR